MTEQHAAEETEAALVPICHKFIQFIPMSRLKNLLLCVKILYI